MSSIETIYAKTLSGPAALARFQPIDPATGSPAVTPLGAPILGEMVQDPVVGAAVGTPEDAPFSGIGNATLIALLKALLAAPIPEGEATIGTVLQGGGTWSTADENGAAFGGVAAITLGTAFTAGRSIGFICTASGNVDLTFADGTKWNGYPLQAAAGSVQTLPYALTNIALSDGSTAAFSAWVLK